MNNGVIYMAISRTTRMVYIGQSWDPLGRIRCHRNCKGEGRFHNAIRKYGDKDFVWNILEDQISTQPLLNALEIYWIKKLNTLSPNGYNLTEGGEGGKPSEEARAKLAASMNRPETKAKLIAAAKIANNRPETKAKKAATQKIAQNRPGVKAKRAATMSTPEYKAKWAATNARPEVIAKHSESTKIANARPEVKAKHVAVRARPEWKAKNSATQKIAQNRPGVKAKQVASQKKRHADPVYQLKQLAKRMERLVKH